MNKLIFFLFNFLCFQFAVKGQDTLQTLNADQLFRLIREFHPIVKQTNLDIGKAQAEILIAKGGFDPQFTYYATNKTYDGTNYYNYQSPEITIPTWFGIEIYSGLENLTGNRLDPTETKGETNYFGISVPLARDLILDKRRANLQQSKIFKKLALAEQQSIINNLFLDASKHYWNWVKEYQTYLVVTNTVKLNRTRLDLVRKTFQNGERAAIDTVEALVQLQGFEMEQNNRYLAFLNAGLQLSVYLWNSNNEPYTLPASVVPASGWEDEVRIGNFNINLTSLLAIADEQHPDLKQMNYKIEALSIDKKLKLQNLLPKADFRYNQLGSGYNLQRTATTSPLFVNNYQYGLSFGMPLRLSKERGEYKMANLKIRDTYLDQNQKRQQLQIKIKQSYNDFVVIQNQIKLQASLYENCIKLVQAEEAKFLSGESSIFFINSRESKALEAQEKLIALKTKYYQSVYALQWSAGLLYRP